MAEDAGHQGDDMGDMTREPSMEDILSSIRRVIARDDAPALARGAAVTQNDVLELDEEDVGDEGDFPPAPSATAPDAAPAADADDDLVSPQSAQAARHSLEALTAALPQSESPAPATAASGGGRSLEDVVVDAMRPMLKQWLDTNLPDMVESMVAREISRITGRRL